MNQLFLLLVTGLAGFVLGTLAYGWYRRFSKFRSRPFVSKKSSRPVHHDESTIIHPLKEPYTFSGLSTYSPRAMEILRAAEIIAATSSTVLIEGESGTGKERIARLLHEQSARKNKPFVPVHAAALPESLLETELFGHEKGAFTGATTQRKGRFELANEGTLFLDEVGELSPQLQVKLLRVVQERTFERVGGEKPIVSDVRLIAATNKSLGQLVRQNKFREDLYYRLNVVILRLLPLRERKEDLPLLIDETIIRQALRLGKKIKGYDPSFLERLMKHSFPGNIRELENIIERAMVFCTDAILDASSLCFMEETVLAVPTASPGNLVQFPKIIERERIIETYYRARGNKAKAARLMGMSESTFRYHLKKALEIEAGANR